ncbi:hypothetical protein JCM8097_005075 [Rhodosporidiobolus ruineniae]
MAQQPPDANESGSMLFEGVVAAVPGAAEAPTSEAAGPSTDAGPVSVVAPGRTAVTALFSPSHPVPAELVDHVLSYLNQHDLVACMLVSKALRSRATLVLLADLHFSLSLPSDQLLPPSLPASACLSPFWHSLIDTPARAALVKSLTITVDRPTSGAYIVLSGFLQSSVDYVTGSEWRHRWMQQKSLDVNLLLRSLPNLDTLRMFEAHAELSNPYNYGDDYLHLERWLEDLVLPTVRHLTIAAFLPSFVPVFPNLDSLATRAPDRVTMAHFSGDASPVTPRLRLSRLRLTPPSDQWQMHDTSAVWQAVASSSFLTLRSLDLDLVPAFLPSLSDLVNLQHLTLRLDENEEGLHGANSPALKELLCNLPPAIRSLKVYNWQALEGLPPSPLSFGVLVRLPPGLRHLSFLSKYQDVPELVAAIASRRLAALTDLAVFWSDWIAVGEREQVRQACAEAGLRYRVCSYAEADDKRWDLIAKVGEAVQLALFPSSASFPGPLEDIC